MIGQLSRHSFSAPSRLQNPRSSGFRRSSRAPLSVSASLVPNFPRLVDASSVREWLAEGVPQLPGFNGEDLTRLLLSDLQTDPVGSLTRLTLGGALLVAFLYWEGGIILHELEERQARTAQRRREEGEGSGSEGGEASGIVGTGRQPPNRPLTAEQAELYERKRGLAWLAIVTAVAIWSTGVVNRPAPFMP